MKNRLVFFVALAAALTIIPSVPRASAQYGSRATIPFAFTANHQELPAGCYKVELQSHSWLALVNCDTGKTVGLMVRTTNAYQSVARGSLEFYNMGHTYWLKQVRFAHMNMESQLAVQPKPEPALARNRANATVEVAMR